MRVRILLTMGAISCASGVVLSPVAAADDGCPTGQAVDDFTGNCVLDIAPISFMDGPMAENITIGGDNYGSVNGIPCTPEHIGTCIGMSYNSPQHHKPQSTLSHSP